MIKKLCILSAFYPTINDPIYAFVGTLVERFADMGIECHVITPVSILEKKHKAVTRIETTKKGSKIYIYCPRYIQFPSRIVAGFYTYKLTVCSLQKAVWKIYKEYIKSSDAIYSHFIESGVNAAWLSKKTGIRAFMAVGESQLKSKELTYSLYKNLLQNHLNGIISVSTPLKQQLIDFDIVNSDMPILVAPNGIDVAVFHQKDKIECRKKLTLDEDTFVVSFVGRFIEQKGFDKLQKVLSNHPDWKCILIGSGDIPVYLNKDQVVYAGLVSHNEIPDYICASDVFVLPTKAEGCCNAIIEAMGCGLPIVSSDKDFNYDILDRSFSLLVDPDSTAEIETAIEDLCFNSDKRFEFSRKSVIVGEKLSIENRAKSIIDFMEKNG